MDVFGLFDNFVHNGMSTQTILVLYIVINMFYRIKDDTIRKINLMHEKILEVDNNVKFCQRKLDCIIKSSDMRDNNLKHSQELVKENHDILVEIKSIVKTRFKV